ncbi:MAG: OmpA family protein [Gammaproteobacteria bacterium]|nr:OmpA family protein [Gammaproteobacteria bacterium]
MPCPIPFDTDGTTVDPRYRNVLGGVAELLEADGSVTATLQGHTDNADPERAERVSRARAQSVADYLVKEFGIDRSRLRVEGFGGTRRFSYDSSAEGRQQNRRVDVILSYPE